jgi:hypothetical protein
MSRASPFIIYDLASGEILLRLLADPAIQNPGEGKVVLTLESAAWDAVNDASPEGEAALLAGVRAALWDKTKALRDARIEGGVTVANIGTFDSDTASRENIHGAVTGAVLALQAEQPFSVTWTLADNGTVLLGGVAMIEVGQALFAHIDGCHGRARDLRAEIHDPEADLTALLTIDVGSGWPGEE